MLYRLSAKIRGYFRKRRYHNQERVSYREYCDDMPMWAGWYEDKRGCLAFVAKDGTLFFDW